VVPGPPEAVSQGSVLLMPSTSNKQKRTMAASAHDPVFAKKLGIPVKVAREFNRADAGTRIRKTSRKKA
jgi:hypothetical protein